MVSSPGLGPRGMRLRLGGAHRRCTRAARLYLARGGRTNPEKSSALALSASRVSVLEIPGGAHALARDAPCCRRLTIYARRITTCGYSTGQHPPRRCLCRTGLRAYWKGERPPARPHRLPRRLPQKRGENAQNSPFQGAKSAPQTGRAGPATPNPLSHNAPGSFRSWRLRRWRNNIHDNS